MYTNIFHFSFFFLFHIYPIDLFVWLRCVFISLNFPRVCFYVYIYSMCVWGKKKTLSVCVCFFFYLFDPFGMMNVCSIKLEYKMILWPRQWTTYTLKCKKKTKRRHISIILNGPRTSANGLLNKLNWGLIMFLDIVFPSQSFSNEKWHN